MKKNLRIKDTIKVETRRKPKMKKGLVLKTNVVIERRTKDGKVLDREEVHNDIVTTGKSRVRDLIGEGIGTGLTGFNSIAIGTGETGDTVVVGDTTLKAEVERALASVSAESTDKVIFEKTFTFETADEYAITEAGVFDSATVTGSTMLDRFVFGAKNVDVDTDLYVKITITVA